MQMAETGARVLSGTRLERGSATGNSWPSASPRFSTNANRRGERAFRTSGRLTKAAMVSGRSSDGEVTMYSAIGCSTTSAFSQFLAVSTADSGGVRFAASAACTSVRPMSYSRLPDQRDGLRRMRRRWAARLRPGGERVGTPQRHRGLARRRLHRDQCARLPAMRRHRHGAPRSGTRQSSDEIRPVTPRGPGVP